MPEHTWGVDIKIYLDDYADWTNAELQRQIAAREPRFVYTVDAWIRQRSYTRWALEALDASLVSPTPLCFTSLCKVAAGLPTFTVPAL